MARLMSSALLGRIMGSALQLQQAVLWPQASYFGLLPLASALWVPAWFTMSPIHWRRALTTISLALLAFGAVGLRASAFLADALEPGLKGQDLSVTGVVAAMPQRNEAGRRFRFDVEAAQLADRTVRLPASLYLGWYADAWGGRADSDDELQRSPAALVAGERWRMTVRLNAPHGGINPFGFDYELWLWEQGLQATSYERTGVRGPAPLRLAQTGSHPVERSRQAVRERIDERVAQRQVAGLIAALVVGDQNAIDGRRKKCSSLS